IVNIVRYRSSVVMLTVTTLNSPTHAVELKEGAMKRGGWGIRAAVARLWAADRPLAAVTMLMLAALVASAAGLVVDPRTIAGAPAWLKPAKFAASTAI